MNYHHEDVKVDNQEIRVWCVNNDRNGNPRYVFHFISIADNYDVAVKIAKKVGGKRYTAKWFGGGIVVQSYDIKRTLQHLLSFAKETQE